MSMTLFLGIVSASLPKDSFPVIGEFEHFSIGLPIQLTIKATKISGVFFLWEIVLCALAALSSVALSFTRNVLQLIEHRKRKTKAKNQQMAAILPIIDDQKKAPLRYFDFSRILTNKLTTKRF